VFQRVVSHFISYFYTRHLSISQIFAQFTSIEIIESKLIFAYVLDLDRLASLRFVELFHPFNLTEYHKISILKGAGSNSTLSVNILEENFSSTCIFIHLYCLDDEGVKRLGIIIGDLVTSIVNKAVSG
jgi:hypothetical protein